jgi:hypothetical protein
VNLNRIAALVIFSALAVNPGFAQTTAMPNKSLGRKLPGAGKTPLATYVQQTVQKSLADAQESGDLDAAVNQLTALLDQTIAWSKDVDPGSVREADFGLRLAKDVQGLPVGEQRDWLTYLKANPDLASTLVFLIEPRQNPEKVFAVLKRLRDARGTILEKYATLTAAICVVHARPLERSINENQVKAADPLEIFDFYVKNESRMFFGIRQVPAELLVWVVDTTASIEEMNWALARYAGDRKVGARFFDIQYDYDNFEKGTPKKVDVAGYNLQNILKCGGICADQAYFAVEVGKSIGVPTAYTTGTSADASHAWVGFLEAQNGKGWWDFNSGRYSAYQGVLGSVQDPQTRARIPDNYVSVLAEMIGTRAVDRQTADALVDAAHRLIALDHDNQLLESAVFPSDASVTNLRPAPRKAGTVDALALTELALRESAGTPAAWFVVRDLAADNKLSLADKQRWAGVLQRLGAAKYPDFTLAILTPMVLTISDSKQQNAMWNKLFTLFQNRFDLAATIRMQQAAAWQTQGDTANAGACYMDVIEHYADAGPFVLEALDKAEQLLRDSKREANIVTLYQKCWAKTVKPPADYSQILAESNWYQVGTLYAQKLQAAGDTAGAAAVTAQLKNSNRVSSVGR